MTAEQPLKYRGLIYAKKQDQSCLHHNGVKLLVSFFDHRLYSVYEALAIANITQENANKGN